MMKTYATVLISEFRSIRYAKRNFSCGIFVPIHSRILRTLWVPTPSAFDRAFRGAIRRRLILSEAADTAGAPSRTRRGEKEAEAVAAEASANGNETNNY